MYRSVRTVCCERESEQVIPDPIPAQIIVWDLSFWNDVCPPLFWFSTPSAVEERPFTSWRELQNLCSWPIWFCTSPWKLLGWCENEYFRLVPGNVSVSQTFWARTSLPLQKTWQNPLKLFKKSEQNYFFFEITERCLICSSSITMIYILGRFALSSQIAARDVLWSRGISVLRLLPASTLVFWVIYMCAILVVCQWIDLQSAVHVDLISITFAQIVSVNAFMIPDARVWIRSPETLLWSWWESASG